MEQHTPHTRTCAQINENRTTSLLYSLVLTATLFQEAGGVALGSAPNALGHVHVLLSLPLVRRWRVRLPA